MTGAVKWEYSMLYWSFPVDEIGAHVDLNNEQFVELMGSVTDEAASGLGDELAERDGDWEAVSHNIARIDRFVLLTFLVRSPA